jgi:hypothetical protein
VIEEAGRLSEVEERRLRWQVPLLLVTASILGWNLLSGMSFDPPPKPRPVPVFGDSDGLPEVLEPGKVYTATFHIEMPADWPTETNPDGTPDTRVTFAVTGRARPEGVNFEMEGVLFCMDAFLDAPGLKIDYTCKIHSPSPGPFTLHLTAGADMLNSSAGVTKDYKHTVGRP